jgi:hypothetical protein
VQSSRFIPRPLSESRRAAPNTDHRSASSRLHPGLRQPEQTPPSGQSSSMRSTSTLCDIGTPAVSVLPRTARVTSVSLSLARGRAPALRISVRTAAQSAAICEARQHPSRPGPGCRHDSLRCARRQPFCLPRSVDLRAVVSRTLSHRQRSEEGRTQDPKPTWCLCTAHPARPACCTARLRRSTTSSSFEIGTTMGG